MLAVEDYLDTLQWAKGAGGLKALRARADGNAKAIADWVAKTPWIENLSSNPAAASNTSVCLKLVDPAVKSLPAEAQIAFVKQMEAMLDKEGVAYDVANHRDAPASLRIWCGCTVEKSDVEALTPWLDWAFAEAKATLAKAA
jgi:phosphoserine aminotransferase